MLICRTASILFLANAAIYFLAAPATSKVGFSKVLIHLITEPVIQG
jgi:hypothetical protein